WLGPAEKSFFKSLKEEPVVLSGGKSKKINPFIFSEDPSLALSAIIQASPKLHQSSLQGQIVGKLLGEEFPQKVSEYIKGKFKPLEIKEKVPDKKPSTSSKESTASKSGLNAEELIGDLLHKEVVEAYKKYLGINTKPEKIEAVEGNKEDYKKDLFWKNPESGILMEYLWTHPDNEAFRQALDSYIESSCEPEATITNLKTFSDFDDFIDKKEYENLKFNWHEKMQVIYDYLGTLSGYDKFSAQEFFENLHNRDYYSPEQVIQIMKHKFPAFEDYLEEKNNPAMVLENAVLDYRSGVSDYMWRDLIDSFVTLKDIYEGDSTQVIKVLFNNYGSLRDKINSLGGNFDIEMVYNTLVKLAEAEKKKIRVQTMEDLYALEKYVPEHLRKEFREYIKDLEKITWYEMDDKVDRVRAEYPTIAKALIGEPIDPKELEYQTTPVEEQYFLPEEEVEIDSGREAVVGFEAMLKTSEKEAENASSFIDGLIEAVHDDEAIAELEDLQRRIRTFSEETLFKIKELGSTRDGWYEHEATKERWYLKMHQKEQTRAEFLANILYEKLGVKVAKTKLFRMRGNITLGSLEIPGAESTTKEEQRTNTDIRSGFIADAFLGNLDVVGGSRGNIVKGQDGHFYRVGNSQALGFGNKNRKSSLGKTIPELESMLNPKTPIGEVFAGLTEEEIKQQARELIDNLSSADINKLIQASGITGKEAKQLLETLISRREFLMKQFELKETNPRERLAFAIREIDRIRDQSLELGLHPRVGFVADGKAIESQMVDMIEDKEGQKIILDFKLTVDFHKTVLENIQKMRDDKSLEKMGYSFGTETIVYKNINKSSGYNSSFELCSASVITASNGVKLKIVGSLVNNRSALGMVNIEIPRGENAPSLIEAQNTVQKMLEDILKIKEGLSIPEEQAERDYKQARYVWHHKLKEVPDDMDEKLKNLKRQEVFPGYQTIVEPGKHKEYEAVSDFAVYHAIQHVDNIPKMIKAGGLICTRERYRRGMLLEGQSSILDLQRGGADSVFTSIVTKDAALRTYGSIGENGVYMIFSHDLLDRTDWYAYEVDTYGHTGHDKFSNRQSPEQLFREQKTNFNSSNEQMFRLGISTEQVKAFVVSLRSFDVPVILRIFKENAIEVVDDEGTTPKELIARKGVKAAKEVLKKNGVEYYNEISVDQIVEQRMKEFLNVSFFIKMTKSEWGKIIHYNDYDEKRDFRAKHTDEQIQELRVKGLKFIGSRTIEEIFENDQIDTIFGSLRSVGVYEIGGASLRDYYYEIGWEKFKEEARKIFAEKGIKAIGDTVSLEDVLEKARQAATSDLKEYLSSRSISEIGGVGVEELAKEGLYKLLEALKEAGVNKLGGGVVADLSDETLKDKLIRQLKEAGIEEVNGRPVEEMVVYGDDLKDLIDISHGREPKLGTKDKNEKEKIGENSEDDKIVD
ncbi:MAG: hypothetical protein UT32_C0045G0001, partial [Parcubacteria group bacterium GW2011_GWC2_39_14]